MRRAWPVALACLWLVPAFAQGWRILPSSPSAGEPFVVQYEAYTASSPAWVHRASVEVQGSVVTYTVIATEAGFSVPGFYRASSVVPGLEAGQYELRLRRPIPAGLSETTLGTFAVGAPTGEPSPQYASLSGNWFHPEESGWGVNLIQGDSGKLFAFWLGYQPVVGNDPPAREPTWLVMSDGRWLSPTHYRGILYESRGTSMSLPFDRSQLVVTPAGYASLRFLGPTEVEFEAQAGVGTHALVQQAKTLRRYRF